MAIRLEIPVFGAAAASQAIELGASRIELNAAGSYPDGGLTPSLEDLRSVAHVNVPVRIMIRPRGPLPGLQTRDFIYSDEEVAQMEAAILTFKETGLLNQRRGDGFVFGILKEEEPTPDSSSEAGTSTRRCRVDKERCARLIDASYPFKTVFHRAFDEVVSCDGDDELQSWEAGFNDIARVSFDGVLTSGGLGRAAQNVGMLERIIAKAKVRGLEIIVGGGVRRQNVGDLVQRLGLRDRSRSLHVVVHSACLASAESEAIDAEEVAAIVSQLI
ncbi:uncharacterized protein GGS25DRAFT_294680 [Hypoxylon fragiforme]|uniref:uncharacterized protein n=1 Tax=Hypoxylon fragiforme TaxID=63214 RepID=UPI0020C657A6|nr:uncharacterized protein GGS25DRAFT_294680 [Hypoxylon fragiforme]KAI2608902.1 hypothetical protein GGS25DRAFT_294680 [Hypoxylon fragiforme]